MTRQARLPLHLGFRVFIQADQMVGLEQIAEQQEVLQSLPLETRLAGLSAERIRHYLDQLSRSQPEIPRKPRRKK